MTRNSEIARAVRHALVMSAVATASVMSLSAQAQDQDQDESVQTVTVTGSRIPLPNLTSISPITAISSDDIKAEGVTRVEDLINNLPQAFADFGGNLSNGATGAATVNLRNLGSQRTLVLVNGRRLMPGDPTQNGAASPDLNQIPGALVQRVEVLTGGASAVYGADAVAGVVNFIMLDNFEGVRFDGQYSFYQHNNNNPVGDIVDARGFATPDSNVMDGYSKDITVVAGVNTPDGKGNATVYLGYRDLSSLSQDQRDFSSCSLSSSPLSNQNPDAPFTCGGSGTTTPTRIIAASGDYVVGPGGSLRPYVAANDAYNFAPTNYYQRPDERKTAGLFAHYDINDKAKLYTEFMFMDDRTIAQIAPSGAFLGGGPGQPPFFGQYLVNCANPLLSAAQVDAFCTQAGLTSADDVLLDIGKRNVEGGARQDDLRHTSYRAVVGSRGDINDVWTYDVYGMYGETILAENYNNDVSKTRLGNALAAVVDDGTFTGGPNSPTLGQTVCRINANASLQDDDPNCVPYNIFNAGAITPDQVGYIQVPGFTEGSTIEQIASASVAGDLGNYGIKMPGASDGLGIAFGAEYRQEESDLRADLLFQTGDLNGQGAPTLNTQGSFNVRELFTEARLPILQDKSFAKILSVEGGYRYSDYSLDFSTDTYKLGADWAPVEAIRFRGSYQRAVRSPNVQELFLQQRVQLDGSTDPCAVETVGDAVGPTFEQCARTGVTLAQYSGGPGGGGTILANPAAQYNGLVGGNANLNPETSDTVSLGFVFTPEFLTGLTVAVDYYDIKVEDLIGQLGADFVVNSCLNSGDPQYCSLVQRSSSNGSLWLGNTGFIVDPIVNTGSLQIKGIDLDSSYRFDLGGAGRLGLSFVGTYVDEFLTEPVDGAPTYDCVGLFGTVCGVPIPKWRHKARANLSTPINVDVTVTWRYVNSVSLDKTSSDPQLTGAVNMTDRKLASVNYIDLSGSYQWNKVTARLGINNVFDRDPPVFGASNAVAVLVSGNTFPQVYDTLGRYVFLGLTADF